MSGGFFRGTSADQDTRFSNKMKKLLKSQKFAPELDIPVDISKVKLDVIRPWIAHRVTELLGFEDEVLINFVYGLLDGKDVDGKHVQIQLTGFMEKNTGRFMRELWSLLTSAQNNLSGIPQQFLDVKAEEQRLKKAENERIASEIQRKREEQEKEAEQERQRKLDVAAELAKSSGRGNSPSNADVKLPDSREIHQRQNPVRGNGIMGRSLSRDRTPRGRQHGKDMGRSLSRDRSPRGRQRGKDMGRSLSRDRSPRGRQRGKDMGRSLSRDRSPRGRQRGKDNRRNSRRNRSVSSDSSWSRSPVRRRRWSRSVSRSPRRHRQSVTPDRRVRSPRPIHSPGRRKHSPIYSRSPVGRKSLQTRRSPPRHRQGASRSPRRRRSPSFSVSPPQRDRGRRSRSPYPRRRSPSKEHEQHRNGLDSRRGQDWRTPDRADRPEKRETQTRIPAPLGRRESEGLPTKEVYVHPQSTYPAAGGKRPYTDLEEPGLDYEKERSALRNEPAGEERGEAFKGSQDSVGGIVSPVEEAVRKQELGYPLSGSDDEDAEADKVKSHAHKSRKQDSKEVTGEDEDGSVSPTTREDEQKAAKRRRREDKRLRKAEKRQKREERHKRREEKRAAKALPKATAVPDMEGRRPDRSPETVSQSDDEHNESQQKRLEDALRQKALESLRAKKAIPY